MRLPFIDAGEIVTTHGVRGEMKLLPWTDGPDFFWISAGCALREETMRWSPAGSKRPAIC